MTLGGGMSPTEALTPGSSDGKVTTIFAITTVECVLTPAQPSPAVRSMDVSGTQHRPADSGHPGNREGAGHLGC